MRRRPERVFETDCCISVLLRDASSILAINRNLLDEEDTIAIGAMAVTRSRMLAEELVVRESSLDVHTRISHVSSC